MTEEYKKRKSEYIANYQRKTYRTVSLKFRIKEDGEILNHLDSKDSISTYIRSLIAADMKR